MRLRVLCVDTRVLRCKERVEGELEEFLKFDFFPRVGGGIGMTRMIAALDKLQSLDKAA